MPSATWIEPAFEGYAATEITGIRQGSSNAAVPLPADLDGYLEAAARVLNDLKLAG
uniref:Bacteriocin family protein n=1 Tax=Bosea sp. NBC_00436 TaxID=2969620 RepID=A0A9E8CMV1_9HYPH